MAANGRVITGFSKPYFAIYNASGETVTYSTPTIMARGVEVALAPESSEDNNFYADNVVAESLSGVFTGGTVTLTCDHPLPAAIRAMRGLPEAGEDGWTEDGENASAPYLGVGYIVRYMSGGGTIYVPTVIAKCKLNVPEESAATQEDEVEWQTMELAFQMMRDDTTNKNWRFIGADAATEAEAEAALKTKLGQA